MQIVFRVDASLKIGVGHVMRCITLANALSDLGAKIMFITGKHQGNMNEYIQKKGFIVNTLSNPSKDSKGLVGYNAWLGTDTATDVKETIKRLPNEPVNWLVVDHYALDDSWEAEIRPYVKKVMVIDDLANRQHDCDILLDQTYEREKHDYYDLVPISAQLLMGTKYALLKKGFSKLRNEAFNKRKACKTIKRALISIGGHDETNITARVLDILPLIDWFGEEVIIDIVLTSKAPFLSVIRKKITQYPLKVNIHIDVDNMAELMLNADLAIGAGGTTSWERCVMALPTILIVLADNQQIIGRNLMKAGAVITLVESKRLINDVKQAVEKVLLDEKLYMKLVKNSFNVCDGLGAKRVAQEMCQ